MRTLTTLLVLALALTSCSKEELEIIEPQNDVFVEVSAPVEKTQNVIKDSVELIESRALRTTLQALKDIEAFTTANKETEGKATSLCFQFVFPLVVKFNDDSTLQLENYSELLQVVLDESVEQHITGIGFPFEIIENGKTEPTTIEDEEGFKTLIAACGYDEIGYADIINATSPCFTIYYPLDLIVNNKVKTFTSQEDAIDYFNTYWSSASTVSVSYPFRITLHTMGENTQTSIDNDFEMINLIKTVCEIH